MMIYTLGVICSEFEEYLDKKEAWEDLGFSVKVSKVCEDSAVFKLSSSKELRSLKTLEDLQLLLKRVRKVNHAGELLISTWEDEIVEDEVFEFEIHNGYCD